MEKEYGIALIRDGNEIHRHYYGCSKKELTEIVNDLQSSVPKDVNDKFVVVKNSKFDN